MKATLVFTVLLLVLFVAAYMTRRRFGVLGLALCAGLLLSNTWGQGATAIVEQQGIQLVSPPLSAVVSGILTLGPALLLLFSGPTYNKQSMRIIGAILFAVFAFTLMLGVLGSSLAFDDFSFGIYRTLSSLSRVIIIAGIAVALGDLLLIHSSKGHKGKDEH
jgi:hypothetical protein